MQIADALEATLPTDFDAAAALIEAALAPPWPDDRLGSDDPLRDGLEGWALWPVGEFVARRGTRSARARAAPPARAHPALQRRIRDPPLHRRASRRSRWPRCSAGRSDSERACAPPVQRRQPPAPALGPAAQGADRRPVADAADPAPRCRTTRATTCGAASPTTSTTSPRTTRRWSSAGCASI